MSGCFRRCDKEWRTGCIGTRKSRSLSSLGTTKIGRLTPRPSMRIEDLAMCREARERLTAARSESA
jgi:hypothetical protein